MDRSSTASTDLTSEAFDLADQPANYASEFRESKRFSERFSERLGSSAARPQSKISNLTRHLSVTANIEALRTKQAMQLQASEDLARQKLKEELDRRRELVLALRERNLESKSHLFNLECNQKVTPPYTFSYFRIWPRETYEKPMGVDDKSKKKK